MKIWKLEPYNPYVGKWNPWYDKVFCFVVAAENEETARKIANDHGGCETHYGDNPWLDSNLTSCVELNQDTEKGIICVDFKSA